MDNTNLPTTQNNFTNQNPLAVLKNLNAFIKIKEFDKVGYLVMPICNKHAVLSGVDKEIDEFTKEEIAKYTALHLKNLTFEEIEIAFQNERFNLYDKKSIHYNFFSIDYFVEIITKYKAWKQNQMTIHNIPMNTNLLPETSKSSAQENIKRIRIEFINHIFNQLHETKKDYISDAFTLYEDFIECKLIDVTLQEKKDIHKIMTKEAIKEANDMISKSYNKSLNKQLRGYIQGLNSKNKDALVVNKCKAYLVCKSMRSHQSAEEILKKLNLDK
jgi:hypothetical protein